MRLSWNAAPAAAAGLCAVLLLQGAVPALQLAALGRFVDQATELARGAAGLRPAAYTLILLLALMVTSNWLYLVRGMLEDYLRDLVGRELEGELLGKAARLELVFFEQEESYDQLQRAQEALRTRFAGIVASFLSTVRNAVTILALCTTLAAVSPVLGPIVVAATLPVLGMKLRRTQHRHAWVSEATPLQRRMGYFLRVATRRQTAKEVRLFGLADHILERWQKVFDQYRSGQLKQARQEMRAQQLSELLLTVTYAAAAVYLAYRVSGGALSIGSYVVLIQAVSQVQQETDTGGRSTTPYAGGSFGSMPGSGWGWL